MSSTEVVEPISYSNSINGLIGFKNDLSGVFQMPYVEWDITQDRVCITTSTNLADVQVRGSANEQIRFWNDNGNGICLVAFNPGKSDIYIGKIVDYSKRHCAFADTTNYQSYGGDSVFSRSLNDWDSWDYANYWTWLNNTTNWTRSGDGLMSVLLYNQPASGSQTDQGYWLRWGMNHTLWQCYTWWPMFTKKINTMTYERKVEPLTRGFYIPRDTVASEFVFSGEASYPAGYLLRVANLGPTYELMRSTEGRASLDLTGDDTWPSNKVLKLAPSTYYRFTDKMYAMQAGDLSRFFWPREASTLWSTVSSDYTKPTYVIGPMDSYKPNTSGDAWIFSSGGFDLASIDATNYTSAPFGAIPDKVKDHLQKANGCVPFVEIKNAGTLKWTIDMKKLNRIKNDGSTVYYSSMSSTDNIYLSVVGPITAENYTYGAAKTSNKILKIKKGGSYLSLDPLHHGYKIKQGDNIEVEVDQPGLYGLCWQLTDSAGTTEYNSWIPWATNTLTLEKAN